MPTSKHFTHCQYCNKEYVCGDCITNDCELGRGNKKGCEHYKRWVGQQMATANLMQQHFKDGGKKGAASVLIAMSCHDSLVDEMTNSELADAVLHELWAESKTGTREAALLEGCIERLRNQPLTHSMERLIR